MSKNTAVKTTAGERTQVKSMSSKRTAKMSDGRLIFFNKKRTEFWLYIEAVEERVRSGFCPLVKAERLTPDKFEREFILAVWRDGYVKWLREHGMAV